MNLSPAALGAIGWLCSVLALCALSFWLGMRVQARRDFRSFESMFRAPEKDASLPQVAWDVLANHSWELYERTTNDDEPTVQQESDHYGVP